MEEIYINPTGIEHARDLLKLAMDRSNRAVHSLYDISRECDAAGFLDYSGEITVIQQALECLSLHYHKQYDFIDDARAQYDRAENKNFEFLEDIVLTHGHLHKDSGAYGYGQVGSSDFISIQLFAFEEHRQAALVPADLRGYSNILGADINQPPEGNLVSRQMDDFAKLTETFLAADNVGISKVSTERTNIAGEGFVPLYIKSEQEYKKGIDFVAANLAIITALTLPGIFVSGAGRGPGLAPHNAGGMPALGAQKENQMSVQSGSDNYSKDVIVTIAGFPESPVTFLKSVDFYIYLSRVQYLFDDVCIQIPPITPLTGLSISKSKYRLDMRNDFEGGLTGDFVHNAIMTSEAVIDDSQHRYKTINDFFVYLTYVQYLFDDGTIQIPPVTSLAMQSVNKPVYCINDSGVFDEKTPKNSEQLSKLHFVHNAVVINTVSVGEIQEFAGIAPVIFANGNYANLAGLMNDPGDAYQDDDFASIFKSIPFEHIRLEMGPPDDLQNDEVSKEINPYETLPQYLFGDLDNDNGKMPLLKTKEYINIDEIDKNIRVIVVPGTDVTDEVFSSPFEKSTGRDVIVRQPNTLTEQDIDVLTMINEDGESMDLPHPIITSGFRSITPAVFGNDFKKAKLMNISGVDLPVNDEGNEILGASPGSFMSAAPLDNDTDAEPEIIPSRGVSLYLDVEKLELSKEHKPVRDVVATDYSKIDAINKLHVVSRVIQAGDIKHVAAKYEDGVSGMAIDIAQTIKVLDQSVRDENVYVQGIEAVIAARLARDFTETAASTQNKSIVHQKEEAVVTDYQPYDPNDADTRIYIPDEVTTSGGNLNVYEIDFIPFKIYTPSTIALADTGAYNGITQHVYEPDKNTHIYIASNGIDANTDEVSLHQYIDDGGDITGLRDYISDDIESSVIREEAGAVTTHTESQNSEDMQLTPTKRIELWLKKLFEMSISPVRGASKDADEIAESLRRARRKAFDEVDAILSHVSNTKGIKKFTESINEGINDLLESFERTEYSGDHDIETANDIIRNFRA